MTTKFTSPPPYIWDRIEKILDEQDGRKYTEELFSNASVISKTNKRNNLFFGSITGISLLLILLKYSASLKIS